MNRPDWHPSAAQAIKESYPEIDWELFEDMDQALNVELWHGPLGAQYWANPDPDLTGKRYKWQGVEKACEDIRAILDPLPHRLWYDTDSECLSVVSPDDDETNWLYPDDDLDRDPIWVGGDGWTEIDVRQVLMFTETWKQVF